MVFVILGGIVMIFAVMCIVTGGTNSRYIEREFVMNDFEQEQCKLIAKHTESTYPSVIEIYYLVCGKSFDDTVRYIRDRSVYGVNRI